MRKGGTGEMRKGGNLESKGKGRRKIGRKKNGGKDSKEEWRNGTK